MNYYVIDLGDYVRLDNQWPSDYRLKHLIANPHVMGYFTPGKLVFFGNLVPELLFHEISGIILTLRFKILISIPIRLCFQVALKLNQNHLIIRIVRNLENPNTPGFICEGEVIISGVLSSSAATINTIYGRVFGNKNKSKH